MAPFGKTFQFTSPKGREVSKEIQDLMAASPHQSCIPAGSSDLGQAAFKIMRSTNLMRMQRTTGELDTDKAY